MMGRPHTPYPDASMRRIGRRLKNILEYNNHGAHAKYPRYTCMTRSSNKELIKHYDEPEQVLHSLRKLFKTTSFDPSSSPEFELFSNHERQFEEEIKKIMTEPTMKEYMMRTREEYGSGIARPKFDKDARFEFKGQFLKGVV
ncbi:hypothetical protein Tco_1203047 [Tanacetum coccineum]